MLLGELPEFEEDSEAFEGHVRTALKRAGLLDDLGGPWESLLQGGISVARRNTDPDSPLAVLERGGYRLATLDALLREQGDEGLRIAVAPRLLQDWKAVHGREVASVLHRRGWTVEAAKATPDTWRTPAHLDFRINLPTSAVLGDVVASLRAAGVEADAEALARPDATRYLATLVGEDPESFSDLWRALYDADEQRRLLRERALAWRRVVRLVLVALRTND